MTYIYALVDPRDGRHRYIGKADNPVLRLQKHLQPKRLSGKTHKEVWLRSVLASGQSPRMEILASVKKTEWEIAEKYWIAYFSAYGEDLTNSTLGGDGASFPGPLNPMYGRCGEAHPAFGKKRPQWVVDKIRDAQKGVPKPMTPEHRKAAVERGKKQVGNKNPFYGKVHSETTRRAWSESRSTQMLTHGGETRSLHDWGMIGGVDQDTIRQRIALGWDVGRAIFAPARKMARPRGSITINGKSLSVSAWSKISGVSASTIGARLSILGWSPEKAVFHDTRREGRLLIVDGEARSASGWSKISGVPYRIIQRRIRISGWDIARAVFTPIAKRRRQNKM